MTATMTSRLVDGLAKALPSKVNRRSFLTRTAVVGSALAADPLEYVLKPTTAYAAVCNCKGSACECGSMCCDGYTEFCCTITGQNKCPANTYLAGWWKADTSPGFCGGPRYYMDCNAPCNGCGCGSNGICSGSCSGTGCGCAGGNCNNRAAGCTHFRYGQCNNQIACLGPIVCRIVTCIPPWALEPTCTSVVRVDENTAYHDRPCLHAVTGVLDSVSVEGGATRIVGWALDYDNAAPVTVQATINGNVVTQGVADIHRPDVGSAFRGWNTNHGFNWLIPHPGPAHTVCVVALNGGYPGDNKLLGCVNVPTRTTGAPFGSLDEASATRAGIRVRGWVIDPDRPDATMVHVYVDGKPAGTAAANLPRPDVGQAYPRSGSAHGFDVTVPATQGVHQVCVYGINIGGDGSPNGTIGCANVNVLAGAPLGRVELVQSGAGRVRIKGFALDPDTAASIGVHFYLDGRPLGTTVADDDRPDVGAFFQGYGNAHGFDATFPVTGGVHTLHTYAINAGPPGDNSLIDGRQISVASGSPFGTVDQVEVGIGLLRVRGWAIDPDDNSPVDIHVYADNQLVGTATANQSRPDVGAAYPLAGPNHGFNKLFNYPRGTRLLQVYAINRGPGSGNTTLTVRPVFVP